MAVGLLYRDLKNIRPVGSETVVFDWLQLPGTPGPGTYSQRLVELPLDVPLSNPQNSAIEVRETDSSGTELPGPVRFTAIDQTGTLVPGSFVIKQGTNDADDTFVFGFIQFSQYDAGRYVKIIYTGRGSLVWGSDVTDVCKGLSLLPGVIKPGHISVDPTDNFYFPNDVHIAGNFFVHGYIDKDLTTILSAKDEFILLNSEATAPGADSGVDFGRGGQNPSLEWKESDTSFTFLSTTSGEIFKLFNDGSVTLGGLMRLKGFTTAQEAALVTVGNIGGVFQNTDDLQAKMIASDGLGGAKLVILG